VISDLGRVVIYFDNHIFFKKIAHYSPYSAQEIAEKVHGHLDIIESFDSGKITPEEFYNRACEALKAKIDFDDFVPIYNDVFSLNPPVLQILKRLKSKYKLVLLSNTDVMRFSFIKKKFPEIFIFDEYVLSYEIGFIKPHPQIFIQTLEKAQAKAEDCLFIDDREENVKKATSLGIPVIHFTPSVDLETALQAKGVVI